MDQMGDDFGVGLRLESVAERAQAFALLLVVLDDAVVHQRDAVADVRMGVGLGDAAVGGPAGMADAEARAEAFDRGRVLHFGDAPGAAHAADIVACAAVAVDHGDAGRIVTAVFETLEAFDQDRNHIAIRDRADYAAHTLETLCRMKNAAEHRRASRLTGGW